MSIDEVAPDPSKISRFRSLMTKQEAYVPLFKQINAQWEAHSILVKRGALVDASLIDTPLKPKDKLNYALPIEREAAENSQKLIKSTAKSLEQSKEKFYSDILQRSCPFLIKIVNYK